MKIYFASDHNGFDMKSKLMLFVQELGFEVEDCGAHTLDPADDYPDFIALAARAVSENPTTAKAIVLGASGQGEAIVANRFPHVRAAVFNGTHAAENESNILPEIMLTRQDNDSNVLSLAARFISENLAKQAVRTWLTTPFPADERHVRRIAKIEQYPS
jgi:ribose 5-phosphate isomerase B